MERGLLISLLVMGGMPPTDIFSMPFRSNSIYRRDKKNRDRNWQIQELATALTLFPLSYVKKSGNKRGSRVQSSAASLGLKSRKVAGKVFKKPTTKCHTKRQRKKV